MKRIVRWIFKGSRISKLLLWVYRALTIAKNSLSGVVAGVNSAGLGDKIPNKISNTEQYLSTSVEVLETVLDWFGVSQQQRNLALKYENMTPDIYKEEVEKLIKEENKDND